MDYSQLQPNMISCVGGLVLNQDPFTQPPGTAVDLVNFEPSVEGGYRRINGYIEYDANEVSGTGDILGVAQHESTVVAARGSYVEYGSGGGWTTITSTRTDAEYYGFVNFTWGSTERLAMVDKFNRGAIWDGTTYTEIDGANAPNSPEHVEVFSNALWLAEGSLLTFSSPYDPLDYQPANGAGTIAFEEPIVAIKTFRQALYVFGVNRISKVTGFTQASFQKEDITDNVGCVASRSIQEIGGDLIFLSQDGLRTIAATARIDDTELGTISKAIQEVVLDPIQASQNDRDYINSVVLRNKSQYRLFNSEPTVPSADTFTIVAVILEEGWNFSILRGIRPTASAALRLNASEVILHGQSDGKIYKQETGKLFGTETIPYIYKTAEILFDDPGIRNEGQRVILNLDLEGLADFTLQVTYDFNSANTAQPVAYAIETGGGQSSYGTAVYGTSVYSIPSIGLIRQPIEGSGFSMGLTFTEDNSLMAGFSADPFTIKGFQIEHIPAGRR